MRRRALTERQWPPQLLFAPYDPLSALPQAIRARLQAPRSTGISECLTQNGCRRLGHHMIDGGYNENYGVAAALDWLTPVLDAHCAGDQDLTFKRVAIVQLRAFPTEKLRSKKPKSGAISALIGPLVGLLQIRTGVAMERNRIDVTRFIETQNNRFCQAAEPSSNDDPRIELKTFVFQPLSESDAPLSWHLTTEQKKALRDSWESQENKDTLKDLLDYLSSAKTEEAPDMSDRGS